MTAIATTAQKLAALNAFRAAAGQKPVAKWKAARHAQQLADYVAESKKTAPKVRAVTMNHAPSAEPKSLRPGSNQAVLATALLHGCTMEEAAKILNKARLERDPASSLVDKSVVSATISYDLCKIKGYGVRAEIVDDEAKYFLVLPKGMTAPVIGAKA